MLAKADIRYFETPDDWYWSVTVNKGQTAMVDDGFEKTYEDALECVRDALEDMVDGTEADE